ncbi:MAG: diguanylate cyclase, partial [Candidatus Berkiella sp.]
MSVLIWQIVAFILLIALGLCVYLAMLLKKALQASLVREEKAYSELLDFPAANPNPVMRINNLGVLTFANPACAPILVHWKTNLNEKLPAQWREVIRQVTLSGKIQNVDIACAKRHFALNIVPMGSKTIGIFGMDITDRKMAQSELERLSTTDETTALPNKVIFQQNLAMEINHARKSQVKLGIFIIRLDDYFEVNNTYGQQVAQQFLVAFKDRLVDFVAGKATVAKISENEFGVIEPEINEPSVMASYVQSIIEICTIPYKIAEHVIFFTISVGISFFPSDG